MNLKNKKKALKRIIDDLSETDIVEIRASNNAFDNYAEEKYHIKVVKDGRLKPIQIFEDEEIEDEWD
ncbi:MAG: hypothetical protein ABIC91_07305 [Nanoarchaeota archaeon]|nr:hypothetical protein [Nanoarchaeota archaeon]MBU1030170.1 hypothetical protein [Nanoarchaeota archaeon]MBU1849583.1 hypothetical protein [Nanoarchaeota archaeon]